MSKVSNYIAVNSLAFVACVCCAVIAPLSKSGLAPLFIGVACVIALDLIVARIGVERTKRFLAHFRK